MDHGCNSRCNNSRKTCQFYFDKSAALSRERERIGDLTLAIVLQLFDAVISFSLNTHHRIGTSPRRISSVKLVLNFLPNISTHSMIEASDSC
mmetsp:Transcript_3757/g.9587  ORF Transcript_3757/g.9587 Transcript_3757/m.9587 type:complete len:92 (-) Transcript_3757:269-544(-)